MGGARLWRQPFRVGDAKFPVGDPPRQDSRDYELLPRRAGHRLGQHPALEVEHAGGEVARLAHGGGEGKSPVGRKSPVTPQGKPTLGRKTRVKKNPTSKFIVRRRGAK